MRFFRRLRIFFRLKKEEIFDVEWLRVILGITVLVLLMVLIVGVIYGTLCLLLLIPGFTTEDAKILFIVEVYGTLVGALIVISSKRCICGNWEIAGHLVDLEDKDEN